MHALVLSVADVNAAMTKSLPPLLILLATGTVPSTGWSDAVLVPAVYIVEPEDGIWDFSFMATAPSGIALPVLSPIAAELTAELPAWCRGVRITASSNKVEQRLFSEDGSEQAVYVDHDVQAQGTPGSGQTELAANRRGIDNWPWLLNPDLMAEYRDRRAALLARAPHPEGPAERIDALLGRTLRVVRAGAPFTQELDPNRVTFLLDAQGRIEHWLLH